jgi:hypothetical protein
MPAKARQNNKTTKLLTTAPPPKQLTPEEYIAKHITLEPPVTRTVARKLIETAIDNGMIKFQIGMEPNTGDEEDEITETRDHPLSPKYYYYGSDIKKLSPRLLNQKTILKASATISYGDGGMSIESDEDAYQSIEILKDNYREPVLILYF